MGEVDAVRRFNRFYTRQLGLLDEGLLRSPFSLTEVRVLYELAHRERATATELCTELRIDAAYMSRMLTAFVRRGMVKTDPCKEDGRRSFLRLSARGQKAFAILDARSSEDVGAMMRALRPRERSRLVEAMATIEAALDPTPRAGEIPSAFTLRPPRAGEMGWIVHRHGVLYAAEHGWDERFEALVAKIVGEFVLGLDPRRERCWIAERDGAIVGSIFLVRHTTTIAKLRLLLVEPSARGAGVGSALVGACVRFAREVGYRKVRLWTNDVLDAARRIYERAGFRLVAEERHRQFGPKLVGQTWELTLQDSKGPDERGARASGKGARGKAR